MTGQSVMGQSVTGRPARLPLGAAGFARLIPVSRETLDRLAAYVELLTLWNRRINLVGRDTLGDVWRRHVLDSAQLLRHLPTGTRTLLDFGSGAGLPGLVLALLGVPEVHLVEADQRKAAFLREAVRITGAAATVHASRIEKLPPLVADAITARALAPLAELLELAAPFLGPRSVCLFLKGAAAEQELTAAGKTWKMRVQKTPSISDPSGCILRVEALVRGP